MNALIRKEVRLLLPSFAAALLLSFSLWLMPADPNMYSGFRMVFIPLAVIACPAAALVMAINSFGREIASGTFPFLLAQPVSRVRLWRAKTLLLAVALLVVLLSWVWTFHFRFFEQIMRNDPTAWKWAPHVSAAMFALVVFSGSLWTALFFRQVAAAFWFTLIVPGAILLAFINVIERAPVMGRNLLMLTLGLYSVAGFFLARRLFLNAQDITRTGGEITLPKWRGLGFRLGRALDRRQWCPRAAFWKKELQLHQSQFVLAGALLLLHLAIIGARRFVNANEMPSLYFVLHTFWVLWLFISLMVGCTAVAEERKLGTLEGQLCLPTTRRRQFLIKFASMLLLSVLFGAVMPVLLEGKLNLPDVPFWQLTAVAALIGLMAFHASTLSRNTLQSLAPTVVSLLLVLTIVNVAAHRQNLFGLSLWPWPLVYLIGGPAFAIALVGLMYWNFKRVLVDGMVWRRNLFVLLATLLTVTTATATLYHRVWELFSSMEPAHGPAVAALSERTTMRLEGWRTLVQVDDGRVWARRAVERTAERMQATFAGAFLDGTNWAKVTSTSRDLVGIQKDGSLWATEESDIAGAMSHPSSTRIQMVRVGTDSDWTHAISYQSLSTLLLKSDGTLWELGPHRWTTNQPYVGLRAFTPQRLGVESSWTKLQWQSGRIILSQSDGRYWVWPKLSSADTNTLVLRSGMTLFRAPDLDPSDPQSVWVRWERGFAQIGVLADGTLRVTGGPQFRPRRTEAKLDPQSYYAPLGKEHDWRAVAGNHYDTLVSLKSDGTIWKWEFPEDLNTNPRSAVATKLSRHSDWVAIAEGWGGVFTLAHDGSLWIWRFENPYRNPGDYFLLRVSRRPERLGNIFETAKEPNK